MRRIIPLLVLLAFAVGCATRTESSLHPDVAAEPVPPDEQRPPDREEIRAENKRLLTRAEHHLAKASKLVDKREFDSAKTEARQGIKLLLQIDTDALTPEEIQGVDETMYKLLTCWQGSHEAVVAPNYTKIRPSTDLEWEFTPEVEKSIRTYLGPRRSELTKAVWRMGLYGKRVKEILREEDVPEDLVYLPIIESAYSPFAVSPAGAVGPWQFIRSTAKRYGLKVDRWIDERRDIEKSTRAACRYLKDLKETYGSWQLALAAYNCGEGRVNKALRKVDNENFSYSDLPLPYETQRYVPLLYAVIAILKHPDVFGFQPLYAQEMGWAELTLQKPVDLEKLSIILGVDYQEIKLYNPELLGKYTLLDGPYTLRIPKERYDEIKEKLDSLAPEAIYLSDKKIDEIKRGRRRIVYTVRRGDSLYKIARKFGVTVSALRKWNPKTTRKKYLQPGDRLYMYVSSKYARSSGGSRSRGFYYTVKKGDTLYDIARKYRVSASEIKKWNPKLKKSKYIYPGMKLLIKR